MFAPCPFLFACSPERIGRARLLTGSDPSRFLLTRTRRHPRHPVPGRIHLPTCSDRSRFLLTRTLRHPRHPVPGRVSVHLLTGSLTVRPVRQHPLFAASRSDTTFLIRRSRASSMRDVFQSQPIQMTGADTEGAIAAGAVTMTSSQTPEAPAGKTG